MQIAPCGKLQLTINSYSIRPISVGQSPNLKLRRSSKFLRFITKKYWYHAECRFTYFNPVQKGRGFKVS